MPTRSSTPLVIPTALTKPRMRGWIHVWSFVTSVVAGLALVAFAGTRESSTASWSTAVYALTISLLFGVSATYHRVHWQTMRSYKAMKRADHSMIFLFIAGSYTPFAMLALEPPTGRNLLILVWTGALAGVALKTIWPTAPRWLGVPLYLLLGWAIVPLAPALVRNEGWAVMGLLIVGGLFYSVGGLLYGIQRPNPWPRVFGHHEFFHAATAVAALCHYAAVWLVLFNLP